MATRRELAGSPDFGAETRVLETLTHEFEELGLGGNEARVILALMRFGSANSTQLAQACHVSRTNIYHVLDELTAKGLVERVPGDGPSCWATPGRDEVLNRLYARHQQRLHEAEARGERVRELLAATFPDVPPVPLPYVHMLRGAPAVRQAWERLLAEAQSELLVFNRPPYGVPLTIPDPAVLEALGRGVAARALYQSAQLSSPESEGFRRLQEPFLEAGVQCRVIDSLPIKLAIADRCIVLLAMVDSIGAGAGFPTNMLIENRGYGLVMGAAFDHLWESAAPWPSGAAPE